MLDIRYHMFYLCAVFLMMGFGILIGEAVYPHQVKVQAKSFQALKQEANQAIAAQGELTRTQSAIDALRPGLVHNKLAGKHVILIITGDYPDAAQSASDALTDAGATVTATVSLTDGWSSLTNTAQTGDLQALAALLAQGTAGNQVNRQTRDTLETQGLVSVQGDLSKPTTRFVLVGGYSDPNANAQAPLDIALVNQLESVTNNAAVIVGCEPLDATVSVMQAYQDAGLATVDCIDQPLGQLDLPFALSGEPASYGLKPTAARQVPATLDGSSGS